MTANHTPQSHFSAPEGMLPLPEWMRSIRVELAPGVKLINMGFDKWVLAQNNRNISFRLPPGNLPDFFSALSDGGWILSDLIPLLEDGNEPLSVMGQLMRLWRQGLLIEALRIDNQTKAVLRPTERMALVPAPIPSDLELVLSEDIILRKERRHFVLERLETLGVVEFRDPEMIRVLLCLHEPIKYDKIIQRTGMPQHVVLPLLNWFFRIGAARHGGAAVPRQAPQDTWAFADRFLHARSRAGYHLGGYGGTYRFSGKIAPAPAIRPDFGGLRTALPVPDLQKIEAQDKQFTSVLEQRCSVREHSPNPMTVAELSEFLYRAARIKRRFHNGNEEHITRPFPAAGGLYEIEFYLVINKCEGLASNFYRYDGVSHSLELVANASRDTQEMLEDGIRSAAFKGEPHVLLILAARFLRVNWKYESIAYSLILKNVGVIYQTMYLVATAMGLAGCALGGGNALSFGRATGLGYWEESAVGEFLLGRPAETLAVTGENGS